MVMLGMTVFAQSTEKAFSGAVAYLEVGGAGGVYSVNIENPFFDFGRWRGNVRLGYGQMHYRHPNNVFRTIPLGIHMFKHSGNHHAEIGAALSYIAGYHYSEIFANSGSKMQSRGIFFVPMVGYRFQRPHGGLFFRVQYSPLIKIKEYGPRPYFQGFMGEPIHAPGLAVGYAFDKPLFRHRR